MNTIVIVTITRLYDTHVDAITVVRELQRAGVPANDISILTRDHRASAAATGAEIGAAVGGLAGLLTGVGLIAIPGIGPVLAGGWLAATAAGVVAGGWMGGALGVLSEAGVTNEDAHAFAECLRRGATLVTARVPESDRSRFESILNRSAINVEGRVAAYRKEGWSAFDPNAAPYTLEQIQQKREPS
jgi:hypothetical protein